MKKNLLSFQTFNISVKSFSPLCNYVQKKVLIYFVLFRSVRRRFQMFLIK